MKMNRRSEPKLKRQTRMVRSPFLAMALGFAATVLPAAPELSLSRQTVALRVAFDQRQPGLSALSVDSLQRGEFRPSPLIDSGASRVSYSVTQSDGWVRYALATDPAYFVWEMRCDRETVQLRSLYRPGASQDLVF